MANRVLVATTDRRLRATAAAAFAGLGCEVETADGGADCLGRLRATAPDLLVLVPPLHWGSVAGVLAAAHEGPGARAPVLILSPEADGPFPHVPRLSVLDRPDRAVALGPLVDRACAWARAGTA
ncbi:MAG: hypothetical protein C0501_11315 [Isosphaera sp.]|nr:hypothetical protein [Isosphaera sp.]